ncbi:hypothetical protein niasHT_039122 [Heterodera trifolii]|uniref:Uncharacterized protein n=1 Tax=Heterodera trifolii TaxID=157864 RepID=A0ABD2I378_9BILA
MQEAVHQLKKATNALSEKCTNCAPEKKAYRSNFFLVKKYCEDTTSLIKSEVKLWQTVLEEKEEQLAKKDEEMRRSERLRTAVAQSPAPPSNELGKLRARVGQLEAENATLTDHNNKLVELEQELKENYRLLVDEHKNCPAEIQSCKCALDGPTGGNSPKWSLDSAGAKVLREIVHQLELDRPQLGLGLEEKIGVIRMVFERVGYDFPESRAAEIIGRADREVHERKEREFNREVCALRAEIVQLKQRNCKQCPQLERQIDDLKKKCEQLAQCAQCEQYKKERDKKTEALLDKIKESFDTKKQKKQMEHELNEQRQKCADLGKQKDLLTCEVCSLREELERKKKANAHFDDDLKEFKRRRLAMDDELKQFKRREKDIGAELEQCKEQNQQLVAAAEEREGRIMELEKELLKEESQRGAALLMLKNRTQERDDLREDIANFTAEKAKLERGVAKLEEDIGKLKRDRTKTDEDIIRLKRERTKADEEIGKLKNEQDKWEEEHARLKDQLDKLGAEKADLETALADQQQQIEQLKEDKDQWTHDLTQYFDADSQQNEASMADERGKMEAEELDEQNQYLYDQQQKIEAIEAEMDSLKEMNRQLTRKLKEQRKMNMSNPRLLQYENDAKQRINDVVEKKRALDQALLLVNQTGRRLEQQFEQQQQKGKEPQQRPLIVSAVGTQTTGGSGNTTTPLAKASYDDVPKMMAPQHQTPRSSYPPQLSTTPTTSATLFPELATDNESLPTAADSSKNFCPQCPALERQLDREKKSSKRLADQLHEADQYTKHLAGAIAFLLADPAYGAEAARMGPGPGTSGGDGGGSNSGGFKRQRTE